MLGQTIKVELSRLPNYREEIREIVRVLKDYVNNVRPGFKVVARNAGNLLVFSTREQALADLRRAGVKGGANSADEAFIYDMFSSDGPLPPVGLPMRSFLQRLDGVIEDNADCAPPVFTDGQRKAMDDFGVAGFGIAHCDDGEKIRFSEPATHAGPLNAVPKESAQAQNSGSVTELDQVKTLLALLDSRRFADADTMVRAVAETNYDLVVVDPFVKGGVLTKAQVRGLRQKRLGARRLVLARISLSEADDAAPYWRPDWRLGKPDWLRLVSPVDPAVIITEFWRQPWKEIVGESFKLAVDLGFDGVMLDGVEAYKVYEYLTPID